MFFLVFACHLGSGSNPIDYADWLAAPVALCWNISKKRLSKESNQTWLAHNFLFRLLLTKNKKTLFFNHKHIFDIIRYLNIYNHWREKKLKQIKQSNLFSKKFFVFVSIFFRNNPDQKYLNGKMKWLDENRWNILKIKTCFFLAAQQLI